MAKARREPLNVVPTTHTLPKIVKRIKFKTRNQKRFYKAIEDERTNIIMAHALAGAGKTFISIQKGLEMLLHRSYSTEKIIIIFFFKCEFSVFKYFIQQHIKSNTFSFDTCFTRFFYRSCSKHINI